MEEKERYIIQEDDLEIDPDADMALLCKILNQQDKRIKELVEENQQLKQAKKQQVREEVVEEIRERLKKAHL